MSTTISTPAPTPAITSANAPFVQALPTPDMVASMLVRNGAPTDLSSRTVVQEINRWAKALTPPGEVSGPQVLRDHWLWLPLAGESGPEAAQYFLHTGTGRVWDAWGGSWCPHEWVPEKNTPRMGCKWKASHITWQQLGQILALTAEAPAKPPGIKWAVAMPPDYAAFLRTHEERHGPGAGCFDVYALRWTRRGKPSREGLVYPFKPRPEYVLDIARTGA